MRNSTTFHTTIKLFRQNEQQTNSNTHIIFYCVKIDEYSVYSGYQFKAELNATNFKQIKKEEGKIKRQKIRKIIVFVYFDGAYLPLGKYRDPIKTYPKMALIVNSSDWN